MPRKKIIDLLGDELTEFVSSRNTEQQTTDTAQPESRKESVARPKYLTLERKEIRLPLGHLDELTKLARQLNKTRQGSGERITENTLIRVAISVLVEHADQLKGKTEEELLESWKHFVA